MKKSNNVMGKTDYFSSIDKLADDFMPKQRVPLSIGSFNPYKQQEIFSNPKKRFDPYENTWGREMQRAFHLGPAQSKELNPKQIKELIHELKEKKIRDKKAIEDVKEIKTLSSKFMNSPWNAVPEKYRKKYGRMDFDGDGVLNKFDCYPFDYDRQATPAGSIITSPVTVTKSSSGGNVYSYNYTTPTGQKMSTQTIVNPSTVSGVKTTSTNTSSGGTPGVSSGQVTADRAKYGQLPVGAGTPSPNANYTYSAKDGWVTIPVASGTGGNVTYTGGDGSRTTINQAKGTTVTDPWVEFYIQQTKPELGDQRDNDAYNKLYSEILQKKLTDPSFKAELEKMVAVDRAKYEAEKAGAAALIKSQARILEAATERKRGMLSLVGGTNLANEGPVKKAEKVLADRATRFDTANTAKIERAGSAFDAAVDKSNTNLNFAKQAEATAAVDKQESAWMRHNVPTGGTVDASYTFKGLYSQMTKDQQNKYDALHK